MLFYQMNNRLWVKVSKQISLRAFLNPMRCNLVSHAVRLMGKCVTPDVMCECTVNMTKRKYEKNNKGLQLCTILSAAKNIIECYNC